MGVKTVDPLNKAEKGERDADFGKLQSSYRPLPMGGAPHFNLPTITRLTAFQTATPKMLPRSPRSNWTHGWHQPRITD